ncbi:MAG: DMT family transporter [Bacillota bacterium]
MNKTHLGYLFMVLSAGSFAAMSFFSKMAYNMGLSVPALMLIQSVITQAILGYMYLRESRPALPRGRVSPGLLALFALSGGASTVAMSYVFFYLSLSLGTILLFTYPAFVTIFAWLVLGERPTAGHLAVLALTLLGALLTVNLQDVASGSTTLLGIVLALLGAALYSLYMVLGERVVGGLSPVAATSLARATVLATALLLSGGVWSELPTISGAGWLAAILSAVVGGAAPFLFLHRGVALIGSNRAAIVSVAELPFALTLGMLFQGDVILPLQWLGTLLIGAAVVVSQRQARGGAGASRGYGPGA